MQVVNLEGQNGFALYSGGLKWCVLNWELR